MTPSKVNIFRRSSFRKVSLPKTRRVVLSLFKSLKLSEAEVTILFVSDPLIQKYHAAYFNDPTPTDVISFPTEESGYLGDILISLPTAARQAKEAQKPFWDEIKLLLTHGLLHLLGYDHQKKRDRTKMWRKQNALLKQVSRL
ncbi:MAG: rRNA maturation RNase YbeY [bacterium]|nr:rRNA maturation RNase YbeY [bacterium]